MKLSLAFLISLAVASSAQNQDGIDRDLRRNDSGVPQKIKSLRSVDESGTKADKSDGSEKKGGKDRGSSAVVELESKKTKDNDVKKGSKDKAAAVEDKSKDKGSKKTADSSTKESKNKSGNNDKNKSSSVANQKELKQKLAQSESMLQQAAVDLEDVMSQKEQKEQKDKETKTADKPKSDEKTSKRHDKKQKEAAVAPADVAGAAAGGRVKHVGHAGRRDGVAKKLGGRGRNFAGKAQSVATSRAAGLSSKSDKPVEYIQTESVQTRSYSGKAEGVTQYSGETRSYSGKAEGLEPFAATQARNYSGKAEEFVGVRRNGAIKKRARAGYRGAAAYEGKARK